MALNFPDSPVDGQIYEGFYWDNTDGVWKYVVDDFDLSLSAAISNTPTGSYTDGFDYEYVSFTSSGTLNVTRGGLCDILLVGGGGAGGDSFGGGGGAGGMLYIENAYLPAGSLDVVVGAGGVEFAEHSSPGFSGRGGETSRLWEYYAVGGGGGAALTNRTDSTNNYYSNVGAMGGSGGGGGGNNVGGSLSFAPGGIGVTNQGNAGGLGRFLAAGGGGGAGAVGQDGIPASQDGGNGGDGLANSITGSSVIYAGGGGGNGNTLNGSGGAGGGGAHNVAGTDGLGGGGGAQKSGGSGIVIVRVKVSSGS